MSDNSQNESFLNKLKIYQDKLLQLGKSNRCVCLSRIYNKHNFDLSRLLENHSKKINDLIQQSFKRKKSVCILPDSDFSEEADVMRRHLKDLARNIKQLEDETGSTYCYFGFPFLEGHLDQEHYLRGPLVLFQISVYHGREGTTSGWFVKFANVSPIFNHTLFAALEKIGGYKIGDDLESDFEDMISSFEPQKEQNAEKIFIENLSNFLTLNGFTLDAKEQEKTNNESNSTLQLKNITRDEIESLARQPLKISNYKIIGSFPQGESAIYRDYNDLISKIKNGDKSEFIADILGETDSPAEFAEDNDDENLEDLDKVRDSDLNLILESDSSQDQVVLASQNRKITLIRGPPGTGKSQVIVNVIANAIYKKQTVLVVCQKRAALEVVHQRLGEKGLDRYTVLLNKEKEDRANMYIQLKQILESSNTYEYDEKQILRTTSNEIDDLIKKHSEIFHALSKQYFGGITIRDLYTKSSSEYLKKLDLNGIGNKIQYPELDNFLSTLSQIEDNYKKFEDKHYSWKNRRSFSEKRFSDKNKIKEILEDILSKSKNCIILCDKQDQDQLIDLTTKYFQLNSEIIKLEEENKSNTELIKKITVTQDVSISLTDLDESIKCVNAGIVLWDEFRNYDQIIQIKENYIAEDSQDKQIDLLGAFSDSKAKSFWKRLVDSETKRKIKLRKNFLERPENIDKNPDDLKNSLQNGLKLWNLIQNPSEKDYIFKKPFVLSNDSDQNSLIHTLKNLNSDYLELEENSKKLQPILKSLRTIFRKNELFFAEDEDIAQLISKEKNGRDILNHISSLSEFVNDEEIKIIFTKSSNSNNLSSHIQNLLDHLNDFEKLQSHDIRKSELNATQQNILDQCASKIGLDEKWTNIIKQEIYHFWIEIIEDNHPILKAGHFDDYKQNQDRLSKLLKKKSNLLVKEIIHSIETNVDFRPRIGNKRTLRETEYNALNHELSKKRKIKPVRKLLEQYEHILFDIAPCWLASPEIVSNIFPLEQNMFDLVIIDEASQLAAERALPCLYRGERIVIAGDEKQLKPHDLFQIKEEEKDDEEDDTIDIESLLLLVKRRHSSTTLQWHYRSSWQELIDFSNHAFYSGTLQVSPNAHLKTSKPPIQWIDCPEGLWENRSNIAEAAKVVNVLYDILQDHKDDEIPTIGIITFNDQQRNIIMDQIEIRQKKDPAFDELYKKIETPASGKKDDEIFVRNIENVQGDERDIIIFSIGYAKDPEGVFRLQFGTLNQDGGENRLNVAITRASKKIIVVCSIDPRDMKVEGTKNPGPKRLKDFLVYANAVNNNDTEKVRQILESLSSTMNRTGQQIKQFDSEFEELVHDKLEDIGYTVETQVGESGYRIDLAIVHPNDSSKYILGVECDGAMFHSGKSVRERDVMRQEFLERRGWNIDRIWSRNWWRNSDREVQKIKNKVDSLIGN